MVNNFLKFGGVSSVEEFYKKFPSEDDFFKAHPEASFMRAGGQVSEDDLPKPKKKLAAPKSKPTEGDSIALYNNAKKVAAYYKSKGYTVSVASPLSSDEAENIFENLDFTNEDFQKRKDALVPDGKGGATRKKPSDIKYRVNVDENKFFQREAYNSILDTRAPMQLFDRRIKPTRLQGYSNDIKGDPMENDFIKNHSYDTTKIKPWRLLTTAEKQVRMKEQGIKPTVATTPKKSTTSVAKKPIITNDPNDPRLKAYNDSLSLYNSGLKGAARLSKQYPDEKFRSINYSSKYDRLIAELDNANRLYVEIPNTIKPEKILGKNNRGANYKIPNILTGTDLLNIDATLLYKKPTTPVVYQKPIVKPVVKRPIVATSKQPVQTPINTIVEQPIIDFSQVEKADGSIGMRDNPISVPNPVNVTKNNPIGYTDHRGVRSGPRYQGTPANAKAVEAKEKMLKAQSSRNYYADGGGTDGLNPYLPNTYLATSAAPQVAVDSRANIWDNPNEIPTIESDVPTLSFEEQMKRRMEKDRAAIEDGRITPEEPKKKLGIKDFLAAGVERLQNNSDKFMGAYNDPISAINMLGYGANIAGMFENKREEKAQEKRNQTQYSSDYMYNTVPDTSGNRGDYSTTGTSYGQFRPDELGAKSPYGTTGSYLPAMKMGGKKKSCKYEEGGEYNLSQKEVLELIKNGAQIEFLD